MTTKNDIQWTADEKANIAATARMIYATGIVDGTAPSKLQSFREAVTTVIAPERQKEIPSLANIAYWATKFWPANTEPLEEIEAIRNERASQSSQRTQVTFDAPATDAVAEQPAEAAPAVTEAAQGQFWTKPEPSAISNEPLFDEAALQARAAENVAEAAASVPVTIKRTRAHQVDTESPEALITKGLTALLFERVDAIVERRTSSILEAKTKTFIEDAVNKNLAVFREDMVALVSTLEESINSTISSFQATVEDAIKRVEAAATRSAPLEVSKAPSMEPSTQERSKSEVPASVATQAAPAKKLNVLVVGIHPRIADQIKREYQHKFNLEVWCGPKEDRRNLRTLMSVNMDGVIVGDTNGGFEIYNVLQENPGLQYVKVRGTVSGCGDVLKAALAQGRFPIVNS